MQLFSNTVKTFLDLSRSRKDLVESRTFQTGPFFFRLWHGHLYWLFTFLGIECRSLATLTARAFVNAYCRTADRLLGGTRYEVHLEAQGKRADECRRRIQEARARLQEGAEQKFALRLLREKLTNPNLVPPSEHIN